MNNGCLPLFFPPPTFFLFRKTYYSGQNYPYQMTSLLTRLTHTIVRISGPSQTPALSCQNQNQSPAGFVSPGVEGMEVIYSQTSNREQENLNTQGCPFKRRDIHLEAWGWPWLTAWWPLFYHWILPLSEVSLSIYRNYLYVGCQCSQCIDSIFMEDIILLYREFPRSHVSSFTVHMGSR